MKKSMLNQFMYLKSQANVKFAIVTVGFKKMNCGITEKWFLKFVSLKDVKFVTLDVFKNVL